MKFDIFNWSEVKVNADEKAPQGMLRLRASARGALFLSSEGVESLVGCGDAFEVEYPGAEAVSFRFEAPKGARVFMETPPRAIHQSAREEVFTNPDRMVHESGAVLEVKRAMRQFQLEQRAALQQIAEARAAMRREVEPVARSPESGAADPAAVDPAAAGVDPAAQS